MTEQVFWVGDDDAGKRIDAYLSERLTGVTRSMVQNWIEQGNVRLASEKPVNICRKANTATARSFCTICSAAVKIS